MPNDLLYNEKDLLTLIAEGDELAFTKLFEYHRNRIYSIAFKVTRSAHLAEEIVQDIFLKIWQKRADLTDINDFNSYLFIITRNKTYSVLKRIAAGNKTITLTIENPSTTINNTADLLMEKEYALLLQKAIEQLPSQQKQVYQLMKEQGLTRGEVAKLLHIQPETVKFHLAQAMKNIRAFCMPYLSLFIGFTMCLSYGTEITK